MAAYVASAAGPEHGFENQFQVVSAGQRWARSRPGHVHASNGRWSAQLNYRAPSAGRNARGRGVLAEGRSTLVSGTAAGDDPGLSERLGAGAGPVPGLLLARGTAARGQWVGGRHAGAQRHHRIAGPGARGPFCPSNCRRAAATRRSTCRRAATPRPSCGRAPTDAISPPTTEVCGPHRACRRVACSPSWWVPGPGRRPRTAHSRRRASHGLLQALISVGVPGRQSLVPARRAVAVRILAQRPAADRGRSRFSRPSASVRAGSRQRPRSASR